MLLLTVILVLPLLVIADDGPWVITTDYGVLGRMESFQPHAPYNASGELSVIPGDAVGRYHDGLVYVVGRGGSNLIRIHNPADGFALVREFSIGAGRNPQDIAFDSAGRAFVSCYDEAVLLQVDTEAGLVVQTFDTSSFADTDGLPETGWLRVHENKLYLTCQLLDRGNWYSPTGPGKLLVLDLETLQWLDPVQLQGSNPYTKIRVSETGKLLVGSVGYWAVFDGGIEQIDPSTGTSEGFLSTEEDLGGDILNFVTAGPNYLMALISNPSFVTSIIRVDLTGDPIQTIVATNGYDLADLAFDGDFQLFVADRSTASAGLRVFDTQSGVELTAAPVTTTLPPFQFILNRANEVSAANDLLLSLGSLKMNRPYPNPCNPAADLVIQDEANTTITVSVFNLRGHRVAQEKIRTDSSGRVSYRFDGHSQNGSALATGLYRVVAQSRSGFAAQNITLVK